MSSPGGQARVIQSIVQLAAGESSTGAVYGVKAAGGSAIPK